MYSSTCQERTPGPESSCWCKTIHSYDQEKDISSSNTNFHALRTPTIMRTNGGVCEESHDEQTAFRRHSMVHKFHGIFLCPYEAERARSLSLYVREKEDFIEAKFIPGGRGKVELFAAEEANEFARGIINTLRMAHRKDICFGGNFSLDNFFLTEDGEVRLSGISEDCIMQANTEGIVEDYYRAAFSIEYELFWLDHLVDSKLPVSLCELLEVMRHHPEKDEDLLNSIMSLLGSSGRLARFNLMYQHYKLLKVRDPASFQRINDYVTQHQCAEDWIKNAEANQFLLEVLECVNPFTGKKTPYKETGYWLIRFVRNVIQHVLGQSIKPVTLEQLFEYDQIDTIISGTFEGFFETFQRAMFEEGHVF